MVGGIEKWYTRISSLQGLLPISLVMHWGCKCWTLYVWFDSGYLTSAENAGPTHEPIPMPWNEAELVKNYGSFFGPMVKSAKGWDQLQSHQSVMGFNRPTTLGAGIDECCGAIVIDDEARKLLEALYPKSYPVFCREVSCSWIPAGQEGSANLMHSKDSKRTTGIFNFAKEVMLAD